MKRFFVVLICISIFAGCNIRLTEAPFDTNIIWGFETSDSYLFLDDAFASRVGLLAGTDDVFQDAYGEAATEYLTMLKGSEQFSIEHPLMIYNPYGMMPGTIYFYMGDHNQNQYIQYQVHVPEYNIPDFQSSCYIGNRLDTSIEGCLVGVQPGKMNYVSIRVLDEYGTVMNENQYQFYIKDTERKSTTMIEKKGAGRGHIQNGLYAFYNQEESEYQFMDHNGIKRASIFMENENYSNPMLLQADTYLLCYIDNVFLLYNRFGSLAAKYTLAEGTALKDFTYAADKKQIDLLLSDNDGISLAAMHISQEEGSAVITVSEMRSLPEIARSYHGDAEVHAFKEDRILFHLKEENLLLQMNTGMVSPVIDWSIASIKDSEMHHLVDNSKIAISKSDFKTAELYKDKREMKGLSNMNLVSITEDGVLYNKVLIDEKNRSFRSTASYLLKEADPRRNLIFSFYGGYLIAADDRGMVYEYNQSGRLLNQFQVKNTAVPQISKYTMSRFWF